MILETFQINSADEFPEGKFYYTLCDGMIMEAAKRVGSSRIDFSLIGSDETWYEGNKYGNCANKELGVTWPLTCIRPTEENGLKDTSDYLQGF